MRTKSLLTTLFCCDVFFWGCTGQPSPLLLGLHGCDSESDSPNLFDVEEPTGEYKLDMVMPYARMVASELVALSEAKKGYEVFTSITALICGPVCTGVFLCVWCRLFFMIIHYRI